MTKEFKVTLESVLDIRGNLKDLTMENLISMLDKHEYQDEDNGEIGCHFKKMSQDQKLLTIAVAVRNYLDDLNKPYSNEWERGYREASENALKIIRK